MKKNRAIISIVLAFFMVIQFDVSVFAKTTTVSPYTDVTYTHQSRFDNYEKKNVIDVSYHNGDINWKKVKADGVEAVFVRIGYTGYTRDYHSLNYDKNYKSYIEGASKEGLDVGVYWYSQALNTDEAKAEANKVLAAIAKYNIKLPVVFDYEFAEVSTGRLDYAWEKGTLNATKMTANANAFLSTVKNAGYTPCIYSSKYFFYDNYNFEKLSKDAVKWLAHYTKNTDFAGDYEYWQYTDKGIVEGISGYTDCNFAYVPMEEPVEPKSDFDVDAIPDMEYTGGLLKPVPSVICKGEELVNGVDFKLIYENNKKIGTATVKITGINDYADMAEKTVSFKIVPRKVEGVVVSSTTTDMATLSWKASNDVSRYVVQVYRASGWVDDGTTTSTQYTVDSLNSASNYKFRVAGYKTVNSERYTGIYSDSAFGTTLPKKQSISYTSTNSSITLKWNKEKYANGYKVYMYNKDKGKYEIIKTIENAETLSYKIKNLPENTRYSFKVRSFKISKSGAIVLGEASDYIRAYTKLPAPTISSAKCTKSHKINMKWGKVKGADGYQYKWSTSQTGDSDFLTGSVSSSTNSKVITTTKNKRKYYVFVRAYRTVNGKKLYSSWSKAKSLYVK